MIIGAPGVYGWTGAVIRMSDLILGDSPIGTPTRRRRRQSSKGTKRVIEFGFPLISNAAQIPQLKPNDYFGSLQFFKIIILFLNVLIIFLCKKRIFRTLRDVLWSQPSFLCFRSSSSC